MALFRVGVLPDSAVTAAASFHADVLPRITAALASSGGALTLVFEPADHTHRAWRLAAMQGLAREQAPRRVNGVVSEDAAAIAETAAFLDRADGVTGQLLILDSAGGDEVVSSPQ